MGSGLLCKVSMRYCPSTSFSVDVSVGADAGVGAGGWLSAIFLYFLLVGGLLWWCRVGSEWGCRVSFVDWISGVIDDILYQIISACFSRRCYHVNRIFIKILMVIVIMRDI